MSAQCCYCNEIFHMLPFSLFSAVVCTGFLSLRMKIWFLNYFCCSHVCVRPKASGKKVCTEEVAIFVHTSDPSFYSISCCAKYWNRHRTSLILLFKLIRRYIFFSCTHRTQWHFSDRFLINGTENREVNNLSFYSFCCNIPSSSWGCCSHEASLAFW